MDDIKVEHATIKVEHATIKKAPVKKVSRKKSVKAPTRATAKVKNEPKLNKYYNSTEINIFTEQGRIKPTSTCMMTSLEASIYEGLFLVWK